ncbi:MAG: fasciclin domain-containing protein [Bacteroidota bacterium]
MKIKSTLTALLACGLFTAGIAQQSKTIDQDYDRFEILYPKDKPSDDGAKAIDAVFIATSGYIIGETSDISFDLNLANTDFEYGDEVTMTFPAGFTINSVSNDMIFGESFDNPDGPDGDPEPFNGIDGQTVSWGDDDNNYGGITPGNIYSFSVNVTVDGTVTGEQIIDFTVSGDGFGPAPAGDDGTITVQGTEAAIELPLDFEFDPSSYTIIGFGGAQNTSVIPNPDPSGVNTSGQVWQQTQDAANTAELFAGAVIDLNTPADFSAGSTVTMDVWTPQVVTEVTLRFEVAGNDPASAGMQRTVNTTAQNAWETLSFDFSGDPNIGNEFVRVVVFFNLDLQNTDDTFYADNIQIVEFPTVFGIVEASADHNTLETALNASGLNAVADDPEAELTLFAPTDAAFAEIQAVVDELLLDPTGALTNVLLYHVVAGTALSSGLTDGQMVLTLQGETVTVGVTGDVITINGTAEVTVADIPAVNGVVHVIDAVLVPTTCTVFAGGPFGDFTTAFGGVPVEAGGVCPLNSINAFENWASEAYTAIGATEGVTYEFGVSGGAVGTWDQTHIIIDATTGAVIASADGTSIQWTAPADGDYIWIIQETGLCGNQSANQATNNGFPYMTCLGSASITDVVVADPDFQTLEDAVILAGLDGTLDTDGPFTVFAPTNAAFDAVEGLADILADNTLLTEVLTHHVADGIAYSTDLSDGQTVPMLNGEDVTIGIGGDPVTVTVTSSLGVEAEVTAFDIVASNGVIHVIDAVLVPTLLSVESLNTVEALSVYPNPTNNQFTVDLELTEADRVTIDIVNVVGQVVKTVDLGNRSVGLNREYIDVNDLSEGIYFMNLLVGDSQGTLKVQIAR